MTKQRSVTCHMGSHSVTCSPTQVNTPRLHPSQTGWYSIYRPFKDGGLSKPRPRVQNNINWPMVATRPPAPSETRTHDLTIASRARQPLGYRVTYSRPHSCFLGDGGGGYGQRTNLRVYIRNVFDHGGPCLLRSQCSPNC